MNPVRNTAWDINNRVAKNVIAWYIILYSNLPNNIMPLEFLNSLLSWSVKCIFICCH